MSACLLFGRGDKIRTCDFYVPNVALYQAEPHLVKYLIVLLAKYISKGRSGTSLRSALPVMTKPLSSLLCNSPIGKSLPLLFARFIVRRTRSRSKHLNTIVLYHEKLLLSSNFKYVFSVQRAKEGSLSSLALGLYRISYPISSGSEFPDPSYAFLRAYVCA